MKEVAYSAIGTVIAIGFVGLVKALGRDLWKRTTPEGRGFAFMEDRVREVLTAVHDQERRHIDE